MIGTFPAECLALVTGIFPTRPPSAGDLARAAKLPDKAKACVREFIKAETPPLWEAWTRPPAQADLFAALKEDLDPKVMETDEVPIEILGQWALIIGRARQYVVAKWPVYEDDAIVPGVFDLGPDEYGNIWDIVRAVDGTDALFGDFASHCLDSSQVDAVKECFPDWFEALSKVAFDEIVSAVGHKLPIFWQKDDMLRVLRGLSSETQIEESQPMPTPKQAPKPQPERAIRQARTPAERIEAGR